MIARPSPITEAYWNCYAYSKNGMHVVEGRLLFSFQLTKERVGPDSDYQKAAIYGNFGTFVTGAHSWKALSDTKLEIEGRDEFIIDDCTKDFLKITSTKERATYYFIAQKSRSYSPF